MAEPTRAELEAQLAAMQRQLTQLQQQLAVEQTGSGGVAQAGAQAAGERGVVATTVQGPVATGDYARQIQTETYVETLIQQVLTDPERANAETLRTCYLARLYQQVGSLDLLGVDPKAVSGGTSARLRLYAIYTALFTRQAELKERVIGAADDHEPLPVSALQQLNQHNQLVLLGEPGSGKSTFVNFVALCLAGENLQRATAQAFPANLALLTAPAPVTDPKEEVAQVWDHGALLPVRVILRDFAARGLPPFREKATADHLWRFICVDLPELLVDYAESMRDELLKLGGLVLLDGLDEVPEADGRRTQLRQAVEDFASVFPRCRLLITGRTYAYQQQAWRLDDFMTALLAPLQGEQIRCFVDRWYAHSAKQRGTDIADAQGRAELLKQAIFASDRLRALAERPLLLTLMASLHAWRGGNLPERREELYAEAVDLLLDRWESQRIVRTADGSRGISQPSLAEFLKVDHKELQVALNRLAFQMHSAQSELVGVANLDERDLVTALLEISRNAKANPVLLVDYLSQRAGLLLPHGVGVYSFPHRTFQEYLAAWHLTDDDYPDKLADLARRDPNRWREVALLAGAKAARGTAFAIWSLIDALCYREPDTPAYGGEDAWGALLAGQALRESVNPATVSARNQEKVARVRRGLLHLLHQSNLPALERVRAGRLLAGLGDPRPEVLTVEKMHFCYVPAGPFVMGKGAEQHTNHYLNYIYWMTRYPITNAQFAQFVVADGYAQSTYWSEAIQVGFWKNGMFKGRFDNKSRQTPFDLGEQFNPANHPAVGVSWYEAVAFTRWLTTYLHERDLLHKDWSVVLPSEAEWEKAARGGVAIPAQAQACPLPLPKAGTDRLVPNPQPAQAYPWGDKANSNLANSKETEIASTSTIGCFVGGASPYGVEELSGNTWEWTRSIYMGYPYDPADGRENLQASERKLRVLRGGSWADEIAVMGCGDRSRFVPYYRNWDSGFRVVACLSTSDL